MFEMYLYTRVESSRTLNLYKFVGTGSISCGSSKEERAQLLIARHLEQVVQHNEEEKTKLEGCEGMSSHLYEYPQCPKQSRVVECGYYVMQFMWDIILSKCTSIIEPLYCLQMKYSPRTYTQDDIDCRRSEWAEFVGKHVLPKSIGAVKPYLQQFIDV
uniref:Ubiquitin-like protease family profile domain-containing protein n=1 Tax=Cucumis melo TaxID=3656 RepID=A0A9I9EEK8_CUCME